MTLLRKRQLLPLVVTASLALLANAQVTQQRGEADAQFGSRKAFLAQVEAENAAAAKLPRPDIDMDRVPKAYPRPPSAWRNAEKALYEEVLAKGRFELLVVPFQVQDHAFARDIRSLMTAQLVTAMEAAGSPAIPDPYVVARALGDGERRFDLMQVFNLANKLGAKRIVLGYVGHDPKKASTMRVTLHYYDRGDQDRFWETFLPRTVARTGKLVASDRLSSRHFEDITFSDEQSPIEAYQAVLPGMLKFMGLQPSVPSPVVSRFERSELPASPLAIQSGKSEPARNAYYYQLLAALAPQSAERVRERLIEKSMLALLQMSPKSPDYRALKARALMNMGLRPAAIQALGQPASAEERHLLALLNGNLPEVRSNRSRIAPGVRALIAALEENAIATAYGARSKEESIAAVKALNLPGDAWQFLAARALTDWDKWTQHNNLLLKGLLDAEFPIEGFTAETMMRSAAVVGDTEKFRAAADLSVLDHVRRLAQSGLAKLCCAPLPARPGPGDYLDLLEGIGTDNLLRHAQFLAEVQGQPESAIQFLGRIEGVYRDHPQLTLVRAQAELEMSRSLGGPQHDALRRSAYAAAFNTWYWEQGQTRAAAEAFDDVIAPAQREDYGGFDNFYAKDYPFRSFYPFWALPTTIEAWLHNAQAALLNSSFDFNPIEKIESALRRRKQWDQLDQVLGSLENRFVGNPKRVQLMAASSLRKGDARAAERHYREGIRAQPMDQDLYAKLGRLLFEEAAPEKAAKVFMSYPGLGKPSEVNPVDLSNYAYEAGSPFYWSGQFELAVPLYEVSAKLRTGSAASLNAETRLSLIKGDYAAALEGSLATGQRYHSPYAYRDSMELLHAMGRSAEAWDIFNALVGEIDEPQLWEAALVGHRMRGTSEKEVAAWLSREPMRNAGRMHAYAPMFLLRAGVTDRTPSAELPALIAAIERPTWKLQDFYGAVVRPTANGSEHVALGPEAPGEYTLARGLFERAGKVRVKSDFVYFAEAYRSIRTDSFETARAALQEAAKLYDVKNESLGYLLPYYAYAAARARNVAAVEVLLDAFPNEYRRFDYYMAKAVIAGVSGKTEESLQHLKLALHRRPFTGRRPVFPEYQYAELCEWLFDSTRNPAYRDEALRWARHNQTFHPWFAWAYAVEARLATDQDERRRAIAMTHYLDKNSERLAKLPQQEVAAAVKEFAERNPFRPAAGAAPKQPI